MHALWLVPVVLLFTIHGPFLLSQQSEAAQPKAPVVSSAADGIFKAFQTHPLVGLGDAHGLAQETDFYLTLLSDARFAKEVGNVVVEFGDAAQQATIDRYVNGEEVPYEQLRRVWADTVGWSPAVTGQGYANFFAHLRVVNSTLAPSQRIHVWLGDPPIDWSKVRARADVTALPQRNSFPAELIKTEILAKKQKALVIYGTFHFYGSKSVKGLVEEAYPNTFFVITPYSGYPDEVCSDGFEKNLQGWRVPTLATPVRGTVLETQLRAPGCLFRKDAKIFWPPEVTEAQKVSKMADWETQSSGITGDALLYLGPAWSLTEVQTIPDFYLDIAFRAEIERRARIMSGMSMMLTIPLTQSPIYSHSYGGLSRKEAK